MSADDDKPKPFDVPLENRNDCEPFGSPVIDFAGVRVAQGMRKFHHRQCEHNSLVYNVSERRIWCETCERTIESFDAFMSLANQFHAMVRAAEYERRQARDALGAVLVRRAAKAIDRVWGRGMAMQCPHCHNGILAHDALSCGSISGEIEIARRKRDIAKN